MSIIQDFFKRYSDEYLDHYGERIPKNHLKTIYAIRMCQSGEFGNLIFNCVECLKTHSIPCCCGNRHCPSCQQYKNDEWLQKQMKKLLPTHYFLVTITLPEKLRDVVRSNQRAAYAALFSCAIASLKKLAKDKRFIGSDLMGALAILHTWGGQLQYHPHIHLIIPGGVLSKDKEEWLPSRKDLFVHTKPLAKIFKAKFKEAMIQNDLIKLFPPSVWEQNWVIDSQSVGRGETALRYLSRYVFRVAISNHRIKSIDNHQVTFSYKNKIKKRWKTITLDAMEFMRRFLQHVLPIGFMKVRHYGFLNANFSKSIDEIALMIAVIHDIIKTLLPKVILPTKKKLCCKECGNRLRFTQFIKYIPIWSQSG